YGGQVPCDGGALQTPVAHPGVSPSSRKELYADRRRIGLGTRRGRRGRRRRGGRQVASRHRALPPPPELVTSGRGFADAPGRAPRRRFPAARSTAGLSGLTSRGSATRFRASSPELLPG